MISDLNDVKFGNWYFNYFDLIKILLIIIGRLCYTEENRKGNECFDVCSQQTHLWRTSSLLSSSYDKTVVIFCDMAISTYYAILQDENIREWSHSERVLIKNNGPRLWSPSLIIR